MRTAPGLRAHWLFVAGLVGCVLAGCGQPVREDRSIPFNADGSQVGFQHGNDGIFLASPSGGPPRKIYQPTADTIAVSTPLWSPDGRQVIFLTAVGKGQTPSPLAGLGSADDPAGRIVYQGLITYTCWRYDAAAPEGALPTKLFTARLDHPGYVAANLAVRWDPHEPRIYFLSQVGSNHVGLFQWDLMSGTQKQVFKETAEAMIFDWSSDGAHIACVLGFNQGRSVVDGVWLGKPASGAWWHVPSSENLARPELPSLLEMLRASRPVFTSSGSRFAFVTTIPGATPSAAADHAIQEASVEKQSVRPMTHGSSFYHDLHWSPDGKRLGFVQGNGTAGNLQVGAENGQISLALNERPARQFVGWNQRGDELAYITPARVATQRDDFWSFLLVPDPLARDAVMLRPAANSAATKEQELLSGMRVTFPQWSPIENKLSLWLTFAPPYRSWLWIFLRFGLRPGDPAAVFDIGSNKISWLAINDYEKTQVGRYYHLKKDYARAREWYAQGHDAGTPTPQMLASSGLPVANEQEFYEFLCLTRLGKTKEAAAHRERFEAAFLPAKVKEGAAAPQQSPLPEALGRMELVRALMHDFLIAEVYLSLDEVGEAEAFFQKAMSAAETDDKRLSALLALSQILLIEGKHEAYLELCVAQLAPLYATDAEKHSPQNQAGSMMLDLIASSALTPLMAADYLKELPVGRVRASLPGWRKLADTSPRAAATPIFGCILAAVLERSGEMAEAAELRDRLVKANNAPSTLQGFQGDWDKRIREFREQLRQFLTGF